MKNDELSKGMLAADGLIIGGLTRRRPRSASAPSRPSRKRLRRLRVAIIVAWAACA